MKGGKLLLRVTMMPRNEICLIDDGKTYLFDKGGKCIGEDLGLIPKYTNGMTDLPVISVLSSSNEAEVALFENDSMTRYSLTGDSVGCVMKLQMKGGFVRMLKRTGQSDGIRYNQMIFVYPSGTNLSGVVSDLGVNKI